MLTRSDVEAALDYMDKAGLIRLARITGKWQTLYCPFHSDGQEKKPSCGCSLEAETKSGITYYAGQWNCFACGAKYPFARGIKEILKIKGTSLAAHTELQKYVDNSYQYSSEEHSLFSNELCGSIMNNLLGESILSAMHASNKKYVSEEELASYRFTVPYMYERKLTDAVIETYDVG